MSPVKFCLPCLFFCFGAARAQVQFEKFSVLGQKLPLKLLLTVRICEASILQVLQGSLEVAAGQGGLVSSLTTSACHLRRTGMCRLKRM